MPIISANGVDISFLDEGSGDVVVLSHGFASNKEVNWVETGWVRHLLRAGYRVIAVDHRGHGRSQKFYKEADYSLDIIATDLANTLRELGINEAHFIGYSMGARTVLRICALFPDLVRRASLGGAGEAVLKDRSSWNDVAEALLAPSLDDAKTPRGFAFRAFAERTKSDRAALAACVKGVLDPISRESINAISAPILISAGTRDDVSGDIDALSVEIAGSQTLHLDGKDHMSAVGDREWKQALVEFFG